MRTYLRTGLSLVVSAGALLLSPLAYAGDAGEGGLLLDAGEGGLIDAGPAQQNCDPTTLWCSNGQMPQTLQSKNELPIGIDTGWMPACSGNPPPDHCSDQKIQVRAWVRFTPLASGQPVYSIDMPKLTTNMDARWPEADGITLSLANGPVGSGTFKVAHGLTPSFSVYLDTPVFTGEISIDASQILPLLPGGQPFNYTAENSTKFSTFGFGATSMTVGSTATDLKDSQLFAISFADLGKIVNVNNMDQYITGSFSFNAVTQSTFTYQTNSVIVQCPDTCAPIASQSGTTKMMGEFENAMDFLAYTKGTLRYSGNLIFEPVINITSIGSFGISMSFPINVGLTVPYDSQGIPLTFPNANVHIPLPNVYMDTGVMAFAEDVQVGSQQDLKRTIENTGEMDALITEISSTSSAFKLGATSTKIPANTGSYDLAVTFKPPKPGKYVSTITVKTNDPDTPVFTFQATGGKGEVVPPDQDGGITSDDAGFTPDGSSGGFFNSNNDSGCGCRTSPTPSGVAVTSFALLGLGLALLRRNRRN